VFFPSSVVVAGTNLKVTGGHRPPGAKVGEAPIRREGPQLFLLVVPLHYFGCKSTISRFGERFRDGQYRSVSLLFAVLLLTVLPRAQLFVKVGARAPRALWSRRHWWLFWRRGNGVAHANKGNLRRKYRVEPRQTGHFSVPPTHRLVSLLPFPNYSSASLKHSWE